MNWYKTSGKTKYDWQKVDWSKNSSEIAKELGVNIEYVCLKRNQLAHQTLFKSKDWPKVDWSKSNKEIAKELGVTENHVRKRRTILAPETKIKTDWSNADWSKSNGEIAKELDVSYSWVEEMRSIIAPETVGEDLHKGIDWSRVDFRNKRNVDLAVEYGVRPHTVCDARFRHAIETTRWWWKIKYAWDKIDWNKSNKEIALELIDSTGSYDISANALESSVSSHRQRMAKETMFKPIDWSQVDWSKSNEQLAEELNRNPVYVDQKRRENNLIIATQAFCCSNWYKSSQLDNSLFI